MKQNTKFIGVVLFIAAIVCVYFYDISYASGGSEPPPVDIKIAKRGIFRSGKSIEIRIKVTSREDMHADISCLLPRGVEPMREKGVMLMPYRDGYRHHLQRGVKPQEMEYRHAVGLHVGPLKKGAVKEFIFHVTAPDRGRYELICVVDALAKWGTKEESFIIDVR